MFTLDLRDVTTPCSTIPLKEADKLFFSESPKRIALAKAMCAECPIVSKCLQFALDEEIEFGIFGGTTPQERKVML
jgi:predicted RecB family nuclease